ncbi:MAG: hypothetical protein ACOC3V_05565 [bacterium]
MKLVKEYLNENLHNGYGFVSVVIKSHPRSDRKILDLLNDSFDFAKYAGGIGQGGERIIDVFGDDATIETVSDVLFQYIENGTVVSVDSI